MAAIYKSIPTNTALIPFIQKQSVWGFKDLVLDTKRLLSLFKPPVICTTVSKQERQGEMGNFVLLSRSQSYRCCFNSQKPGRCFWGDKDKRQLTIGKVNVFGDLVPGSVVKVADLLLVLHHVGWLASFLVLHGNVVLDRLEILPVLWTRGVKMSPRFQKTQMKKRFSLVFSLLWYMKHNNALPEYFHWTKPWQ